MSHFHYVYGELIITSAKCGWLLTFSCHLHPCTMSEPGGQLTLASLRQVAFNRFTNTSGAAAASRTTAGNLQDQ